MGDRIIIENNDINIQDNGKNEKTNISDSKTNLKTGEDGRMTPLASIDQTAMAFPNVANFRDVAISIGGWVNCTKDRFDPNLNISAACSYTRFQIEMLRQQGLIFEEPSKLKEQKTNKPGVYIKPFNLFRSARLDSISREELDLLTNMFSIRCVIDLRSETEVSLGFMSDCFPASFINEELVLKSIVHSQVAIGSFNYDESVQPIIVEQASVPPSPSTEPMYETNSHISSKDIKSPNSISESIKSESVSNSVDNTNSKESSGSISDDSVGGNTTICNTPDVGKQSSQASSLIKARNIPVTRVTYRVNFAGSNFRRCSVWKPLTKMQKLKVIALMITNNKPKVIEMVGREILQPKGLLGLNKNFIDYSGQEIVQVLRLMTFRENYPLLVHCTQGKDRTGIIIALALYCAGVKEKLILKDYHRSQKGLDSKRDEMVQEMAKTGLGPEFADAPIDVLSDTFKYIKETYGSVDKYLDRNGFFSGDRLALRNCLIYVELGK